MAAGYDLYCSEPIRDSLNKGLYPKKILSIENKFGARKASENIFMGPLHLNQKINIENKFGSRKASEDIFMGHGSSVSDDLLLKIYLHVAWEGSFSATGLGWSGPHMLDVYSFNTCEAEGFLHLICL